MEEKNIFSGAASLSETLNRLYPDRSHLGTAFLHGQPVSSFLDLNLLYLFSSLIRIRENHNIIELPCLEDLVFVGNPLEEKHSAENNWIEEATKRVPKLKKLDGTPVIKGDEEEDN
uniref:Uncharacterized protein n=1 Tax=Piliocolobus tephrosceles TaxID=591936 RepID=A0A8C9II39_9PRIM